MTAVTKFLFLLTLCFTTSVLGAAGILKCRRVRPPAQPGFFWYVCASKKLHKKVFCWYILPVKTYIKISRKRYQVTFYFCLIFFHIIILFSVLFKIETNYPFNRIVSFISCWLLLYLLFLFLLLIALAPDPSPVQFLLLLLEFYLLVEINIIYYNLS